MILRWEGQNLVITCRQTVDYYGQVGHREVELVLTPEEIVQVVQEICQHGTAGTVPATISPATRASTHIPDTPPKVAGAHQKGPGV